MPASFDHIATTYDDSFTGTRIGTLQRKLVWHYIEKIIPELKGTEILELNCGTGEDAILFGEKGFNIVATDISEEMLKVTDKKVAQFSMQHKVHTRYLNMEDFDEALFAKKFDLIFSNFGGANCLSPVSLKMLLAKVTSMLNPRGRFIAVIMPKFCLWESLYFLFKFQFSQAFRRWTNREVHATINGANTSVWYYNPSFIRDGIGTSLLLQHHQPIGLVLPPSYLESFFKSRGKALLRLNSLEARLNSFSFLSPLADHFIIDLKKI
jgi:ubiquinone/menaquinone biosynthesis C-methylase UbiE